MRIALMIHALYGGGAERLMANLASRWSSQHEVHLVTWSRTETDTYTVPENVQRHGLDLLRVSPNPVAALWANWRRVRRLRQCLQDLNPQIILSFSDRTNIATLQAARGLGLPVWISEHSDPAKQKLGFMWENWRRWTYPHCTGCTVLTAFIAETMQQWIAAEKIRVIPPAIDPVLPVSAAPEPQEPSSANSAKRIVFVGRLSQEKRVDVLLKAWSLIAEQLPNWELQIIGDGDLRQSLEAQASQTPRTMFTGWVAEPANYLRNADIFALSSDYEGFPVALLEAMDQGLACIATECTQSMELLNEPHRCVLTSPTGSSRDYAAQLSNLCQNEGLRAELGEAARQRAADFHWSKIGPLWDKILADV